MRGQGGEERESNNERNPNQLRRIPFARKVRKTARGFPHPLSHRQECSQKCHRTECVGVAWGLVKAECLALMTTDILSSVAAYIAEFVQAS